MSIYERIAEEITRQERQGKSPHAVLLSDEAFSVLAETVRAEDEERQRQRGQSQAFLDWLHVKHGASHRKLEPHEPREASWDGSVFGLPLERISQHGYHIGVR